MNKSEHINYWLRSGNESWDAAIVLMQADKFVESLFFFCLSVEKCIKAIWVLDNIDQYPPRIHDLGSLYSQTDLKLVPELVDFLDTVNRWNIEGRYPDYRFSLHELATENM